jgi:hypothetical protein
VDRDDQDPAITFDEAANEHAEGSWIAATTGHLLGTSFHSLDSDRADGRERGTAGLADIANLHRTDTRTGPLGQALRAHLARCVTWQCSPQKYAVVEPGNALIRRPGLHPAQCRSPRQPHDKGPDRPACGSRLDQPGDDGACRPGQAALGAQQRLLGLLSPQHPAEEASRTFTDLRLISALLCSSWPHGRDLMDPARPPRSTTTSAA